MHRDKMLMAELRWCTYKRLEGHLKWCGERMELIIIIIIKALANNQHELIEILEQDIHIKYSG